MKATLERAPGSRVVLDIEVSPEEMQTDIEAAIRRLARQVRVPGFRPGKAPQPMVERALGRPRVLQEALDPMVTRAYRAVIDEQGLAPVDQPEIDVQTFEEGVPLQFRATVVVRPEVALPDWSGMTVTCEVAPVSDADIEQTLGELREAKGTWVPSTEPAAAGDMVILRTNGKVEGGPKIGEPRVEGVLGDGRLRAEIDAGVLGQAAGTALDLDLTFGAADPVRALAGKAARLRVEVLEVKRRELPVLDDAFAAEVSERQTLEELRADLGNTLRRVAEGRADQAALDRAVAQVVEGATVELPDILVERSVDNLVAGLERQAKDAGVSLEVALGRQGTTVAAARQDLRPDAERRVKVQLVLDAVAARAGLAPTEAEIDREIVRMANAGGVDPVAFRSVAMRPDNLAAIRGDLTRGRAARHLRDALLHLEATDGSASAEPEAPGAEADPAAEPAPVKPRGKQA